MEWLTTDNFTVEVLLKLLIAATLSLIIGIERELKKKPVGLKHKFSYCNIQLLINDHID